MQDHFFKTAGVLLAVSSILLLAISCMKEKPESLPEHLEWNPEFAIPLGDDQFGLNAESGFDTTLLELDTITGLPEWIDEDTIFLEGTMELNMSSLLENLEHINRILFRVNIYNEFPHEVYSQAYFRDAGLNVIDSLFDEGPISTQAGQVKADGSAITPGYSRKDALFYQERLLSLEDANHLFFRAGFLVTDVDSTLIPYYPDFEYTVDIGAMVEISSEY